MTEFPLYVESLKDVRELNGFIRIENSPAFTVFTYLPNLRHIHNWGEGPAITLKGNDNLALVEFPSLQSIYSKDSPRVIIKNNPRLVLDGNFSDLLQNIPEQHKQIAIVKDTSTIQHIRHARQVHTSIWRLDGGFTDIFSAERIWVEAIMALSLVLLLLLLCCAYICKLKGKQLFCSGTQATSALPRPNYRLNSKQQLVLRSLCEDVLVANPLLWKLEETELLWQYKKRCKCDRIGKLLKRHGRNLKQHMIQLAKNGSLSYEPESNPNASIKQRLIFERLRKMFLMRYVVLIGTENDPTCVLPKIPTVPGEERTYENDSSRITIRSTAVKKASKNSRLFIYDVECKRDNRNKHYKLEFIYFVWGRLDLYISVEEVLRLVQYCENPNQSLCVSNRHKEVFSLLNLLYTIVVRMETPIQLSDAFKLHNEKCNGFMLDRNEMIFVMKFLLIWALRSGVLPRLHKGANSWLDTYDAMAAFQKMHPNVMSFHPFHLAGLPAEVIEEVYSEGGCAPPRFSYRKESIMRDRFTFHPAGATIMTDYERNVELGKLRRLEQEKEQPQAPEKLSTTTEMKPNEEQVAVQSRKRRKGQDMEDYWASKEQQILELKAKRRRKKLGFSEKDQDEAFGEQQRPGKADLHRKFDKQEELQPESPARFMDNSVGDSSKKRRREQFPYFGQDFRRSPEGISKVPQGKNDGKTPKGSRGARMGQSRFSPVRFLGHIIDAPYNRKSTKVIAVVPMPKFYPAAETKNERLLVQQAAPIVDTPGKSSSSKKRRRSQKDMKKSPSSKKRHPKLENP